MRLIAGDDEWFTKKGLLAFAGLHLMSSEHFRSVSDVPLKPGAAGETAVDVLYIVAHPL